MFTLLISALSFIAFVWLVTLVITLYGFSRQRPLLATPDLRLTASDAPLVSILVPARNEQQRVLEPCIRSILAQDYGHFEVIAVDDRSTDNTGRKGRRIYDRRGVRPPRLHNAASQFSNVEE